MAEYIWQALDVTDQEKLVWKGYSWLKTLKGQCHEEFAVLGQFCAKIITFRL